MQRELKLSMLNANLLNTKMGANIKGAGTSIIRVEGVEAYGCTHTIQTVLKQTFINCGSSW